MTVGDLRVCTIAIHQHYSTMVEEGGTVPAGQGESGAPGQEVVHAEQNSPQDDSPEGAAVAEDDVNNTNEGFVGLVRCV